MNSPPSQAPTDRKPTLPEGFEECLAICVFFPLQHDRKDCDKCIQKNFRGGSKQLCSDGDDRERDEDDKNRRDALCSVACDAGSDCRSK